MVNVFFKSDYLKRGFLVKSDAVVQPAPFILQLLKTCLLINPHNSIKHLSSAQAGHLVQNNFMYKNNNHENIKLKHTLGNEVASVSKITHFNYDISFLPVCEINCKKNK